MAEGSKRAAKETNELDKCGLIAMKRPPELCSETSAVFCCSSALAAHQCVLENEAHRHPLSPPRDCTIT